MKIKNWIACIQDRGKWKKEVVEKDNFQQLREVQRLEEEEEATTTEDFELHVSSL
jgi:hypothetical protein